MQLNDYQTQSRKTALYPEIGQRFVYPAFGLAGEVGELVNKIKKIFRDDDGAVTDEKRRQVSEELGDVLWYVAQIATELDLSLDEVAQANLEKLQSRQKRGVLHGEGDYR